MSGKISCKLPAITWKELFIWAVFIGSVVFIAIYGTACINVTNDDWLYTNGDMTQHYLGWKFYRRTDWCFPIGLIDGLVENSLSIIYTDSIPLFAVFFKILAPILPEPFQYLGIWGVSCFVLQAFFSMIIIMQFTKERKIMIPCSFIFILFPVILQRLFSHTALAANWLILAALAIWFYRDKINGLKKNMLLWSILMSLSVLIHMYYLPMILAIMCGNFLNRYLDSRSKENILVATCSIIGSIISALIFMYLLGAFNDNPGVKQGGIEIYGSNLNALYNPLFGSTFLKVRSVATEGQGEGFAYLGMGVIVMLLLGIVASLQNFNREWLKSKTAKGFLISAVVLAIVLWGYALSPAISFNKKILFTIPWPEKLKDIFSIFRVSGRFIWPICYMICLGAIFLNVRFYRKSVACIIIWCCLVIQLLDLHPMIVGASERPQVIQEHITILQDDAWTLLGNDFGKVQFITSYTGVGNPTTLITQHFSNQIIFDLADYACDHQITLNDFYVGRRNGTLIEKHKYESWCSLLKGEVDKETIYIFKEMPEELLSAEQVNIYMIDNLIVGIKSNYKWDKEPLKISR